MLLFIALLSAKTGDRVWWQWTPSEMEKAFALKQIETCLSPSVKDDKDDKCEGEFVQQLAINIKSTCNLVQPLAIILKVTCATTSYKY